jgi:hypothetical protein
LSQRGHCVNGALPASGREYAGHTDFDEVIERLIEVARHIESTMAGDFERTRQFNQLPHPLFVHGAVNVQNAEDHTGGAELFGNENIALHDAEFIRGVTEITASRTNHYLQANFCFLTYRCDHAGTGRSAAFGQTGTKFNPVCSTTFSCDGGFHRIKANLQQN